ncbi:DUF2339 domain-containing protein [Occallatibacter savannae]|uniref:DUF2339 domain-containing protein n=1 Tax=Occallatibacter savannae TaxID=1002691 RepID=UPI000D69634A|nr:DUF2339 domain-containing protein [Occallatibacter savannae]
MELFLIAVVAVALIILWNRTGAALDRTRSTIDRLQSEIDFLRSQLAALARNTTRSEEPKPAAQPAAQTPPAAAPAPPQPAPQQSVHSAPAPLAPFTPPVTPRAPEPPPAQTPPVQQPLPSYAPQPQPGPSRPQPEPARAHLASLEQTLGANWLGKIGVASLVIGIASFLAWKLQTWGPGGKVFCGFAVSLLLLGGGIWLERKPTYRLFARAGIGGGWALAYFTTFAAYHLQAARVLSSLPVDLVLMLLVAAGMVGHSLLYRSQTVTSLAFLLGFGTLLTSHIENPTETVVFSLAASAILAIALVVVTTIRHWAQLELCGLIAVYISHFVWLNEVLPQNHAEFAQFWPSTTLILLYWLIFRLAYVLRTPLDRREEDFSSVSAILNSAGVLGLLKFQSAHPEWAFWALLVLGAIEMSLAWWSRSKRRQAFVVLSTIAVVLLVSAVPFRFHGVSWPVLWLIQAQVLAIAGLRLGEPIFRRLGLIVGLITGAVLALHDVMPLAFERLVSSDTGTHWSLTAGLALAAVLYWTHAEIYPRRWPAIATHPLEAIALLISSWLALGAAATSLWVAIPAAWLPVAWLLLVLVIGLAADRFSIARLTLEADALAVAALLAIVYCDLPHDNWAHRTPLLISVALLYCGMLRKTSAGSRNYAAAAYSWASAALLPFVTWNFLEHHQQWIAITLVAESIALFEIGRFTRKNFLRWQGYALIAIAYSVYITSDLPLAVFQFPNPPLDRNFTLVGSNLLSVLILLAAGYWFYERTRTGEPATSTERVFGLLGSCAGLFCLIVWTGVRLPIYFSAGEVWIATLWAAFATSLLAIAWLTHRRLFLFQAIALALAAVLRALLFDLAGNNRDGFWHGPLFHASITALILLAALPFAFKMRDPQFWSGSSLQSIEPMTRLIRSPEQGFFFSAFGLMIIALAAKLTSGHITIAWSLLGLGTFLFALAVGERSFRLAGLGLLLVSISKIVLIDIWQLSTPDRFMTLIILGAALIAVSFLYTRFSSTIRKYL